MHARQVTGLDVQRTDLGAGAAVGALAGLNNHLAHCVLFEQLQLSGNVGAPSSTLLFGEVVFLDGCLQLFDLGHAGLLVCVLQGSGHLVEVLFHTLGDGGIGHVNRPFLGLRVDLCQELGLLFAEGGDCLLAKGHGRKHILFGDFLSASLNHGDVVLGAGNGELEVGVLFLFIRGVHDELARVDVATDAYACSRAIERSAGYHQSSRGAGNGDGVGLMLAVNYQRSGNDVNFLFEAVGKARANRAVDHTSRQDALVGGLGLALQIAAGDAAHSVHLFHEVDRQREEVVVLLLLGDNRRYQNGGVAAGNLHRTGSLLCKLARFDGVVLPVEVERFGNNVHSFFHFPCALLRKASLHPLFRCASSNGLHCRPPYIQKAR